jgi:hypothetical protein
VPRKPGADGSVTPNVVAASTTNAGAIRTSDPTARSDT